MQDGRKSGSGLLALLLLLHLGDVGLPVGHHGRHLIAAGFVQLVTLGIEHDQVGQQAALRVGERKAAMILRADHGELDLPLRGPRFGGGVIGVDVVHHDFRTLSLHLLVGLVDHGQLGHTDTAGAAGFVHKEDGGLLVQLGAVDGGLLGQGLRERGEGGFLLGGGIFLRRGGKGSHGTECQGCKHAVDDVLHGISGGYLLNVSQQAHSPICQQALPDSAMCTRAW